MKYNINKRDFDPTDRSASNPYLDLLHPYIPKVLYLLALSVNSPTPTCIIILNIIIIIIIITITIVIVIIIIITIVIIIIIITTIKSPSYTTCSTGQVPLLRISTVECWTE